MNMLWRHAKEAHTIILVLVYLTCAQAISSKDSDDLDTNSNFGRMEKRLSEFLGGPGKRLSEFLGGPGKRLSEFLGGPGKRVLSVDDEDVDTYFMPGTRYKRQYGEPDGSEFLGGPGRKRKRSYSAYRDDILKGNFEDSILRPSKRLSEFLGGPGKRYLTKATTNKRLSEFLGGPGKRLSEFLGGPGKRLSEFLGGPGKR